jgi:hypothetical protein
MLPDREHRPVVRNHSVIEMRLTKQDLGTLLVNEIGSEH